MDFLARFPGAGSELIQVCADPSDPETLARELRGLAAAAEEHAGAARRLLVLNRDALSLVRAPGVKVQPAYEWLLRDRSVPSSTATNWRERLLNDLRGCERRVRRCSG